MGIHESIQLEQCVVNCQTLPRFGTLSRLRDFSGFILFIFLY